MGHRGTRVWGALGALALLLAACSDGAGDGPAAGDATTTSLGSLPSGAVTQEDVPAPDTFEILSSRPDMVTGGELLLRADDPDATITVDGSPAEVSPGPVEGTVLVGALPEGASTLTVGGESIAVTDHPVSGPVFSGPHLPLLACSTEAFGLGEPTDENCSAESKREQKALGDVAFTLETGVVNRAVYLIATPDDGWNGRLVYRFGGGCGTSYAQGTPLTGVEDERLLGAGYAVATATFNTFQVMCNDVLSAETLMMVKEHFTETHGPPEFTIGEGASGGAIQQHLIVQNYPGLLDAAAAILPFPDAMTTALSVTDCGLLGRYFDQDGADLSPEQQLAITGFASPGTCPFWRMAFLPGIDPTAGCTGDAPEGTVYDPDDNPDGVRCTLTDANVHQFGIDPATGFARRPLDNVGVEYGRRALLDGVISVDQFLDLNEDIGGYDIDGAITPEREVATEEGLRAAYGKGRVSVGGGDQRTVPIIELNIYTDDKGDIHDRWRAFALRDRLASDNLAIWTRGDTAGSSDGVIGNIATGGGNGADVVAVLDEWLTTGEMPDEAVDNCPDADGGTISGEGIYDEGPCAAAFPLHLDPRQVAGAPRSMDILKCQLQPVDPTAYPGREFTPEQAARLAEVFPDGVCDWSKPSVGYTELEGTWLRY